MENGWVDELKSDTEICLGVLYIVYQMLYIKKTIQIQDILIQLTSLCYELKIILFYLFLNPMKLLWLSIPAGNINTIFYVCFHRES